MEGTNSRLDRILTGLQQTLTQCDSEIGAITSQILVREEALGTLEADTENFTAQYQKYQETVSALQEKNEIVEARLLSSENEIRGLEAKIANLSKSKSDPEVQNLIDLHQATINHHQDILAVGKTELTHDREQQEEIKRLMESLLKEMKKTPSNKIDQKKTLDEIDQLKESHEALSAARSKIVSLVNKLDPNRTTTGQSKILNECEQRKRKLDDAFARTPGSTPGNSKQAKRMRPATPMTPKRGVTRQVEQPAEIPTMQVESANPAPTLLAPFLPPTAAKLLLLVDGRFDSIEWYPSTVKIPMGDDISNSFGKWVPAFNTPYSFFLCQIYQPVFKGLLQDEYRIIAIDPASVDHSLSTLCVPLATTKNKAEAVMLLDLIGDIEEHPTFDYGALWQLLSKDS